MDDLSFNGGLETWSDERLCAWIRQIAAFDMLRTWLATTDAFAMPHRHGVRFHAVARVVWPSLPRSVERIRFDIHRLRYHFLGHLGRVVDSGMRSTPYEQWPWHLRGRVPRWWQVYDIHIMRTQVRGRTGTGVGSSRGSLGSPPPYSPPANDFNDDSDEYDEYGDIW